MTQDRSEPFAAVRSIRADELEPGMIIDTGRAVDDLTAQIEEEMEHLDVETDTYGNLLRTLRELDRMPEIHEFDVLEDVRLTDDPEVTLLVGSNDTLAVPDGLLVDVIGMDWEIHELAQKGML